MAHSSTSMAQPTLSSEALPGIGEPALSGEPQRGWALQRPQTLYPARKQEEPAKGATRELKATGKLAIPGLCRQTRQKPATKAGNKEASGKVTMAEAKPAKTAIKAHFVSATQKSIRGGRA